MQKIIKWGILGTGYIAHKFATSLKKANNAELISIGSRNENTAILFANEFNIPNVHSSYESLAKDKDVDIIYIASLNTQHKQHTLLCLNNNKNVLCEKPFCININEANEMIKTACFII